LGQCRGLQADITDQQPPELHGPAEEPAPEEYITRNATQGAFLNDMVAYPGGVIQDTVQYLWVDNCTAYGDLPMHEPPGP